MSAPRIGPGEILPLMRRLGGAPDPLALYAALCDGGRRPDTLLLESADATEGGSRRSLVVARSMLRITCRGGAVEVTPLTANGGCLAETMAPEGRTRGGGGDRRGEAPSPAAAVDLDERARLFAPGPLDALRSAVLRPTVLSDAGPFALFAAGIFGYDLVDIFERLPPPRSDGDGFPQYVFWVPDRSILIDPLHGTTTIHALVVGGPDSERAFNDAARDVEKLSRAVLAARKSLLEGGTPAAGRPSRVDVDLTDEDFAALVRELQEHVRAGDVFQIVPSRTFTTPCDDPLPAYARLRAQNPTPYQFFIRAEDFVLFGASPETALRVEGRPPRVVIRPIAGTAPRGRSPEGAIDPEADARLQAALLTSRKELSEHLMLLDLARNDVARVSRPGTRAVSRLLTLESYRRVTHLVSEVTGELAEGLDALHAYAATLNMGTLVGAPKIRAAEILRRRERSRRGAYGGAVGFLTHEGSLDTAIVIRAAFVRGGVAAVRAGAGVVLESDPDSEAAETRHKASAILAALGAEGMA